MFTSYNNLKVLELFFKNPNTKFHLREISRRTKLSVAGVSKILGNLVKSNFLLLHKGNVTNDYLANVDNIKFKNLKICYNLYNIKISGIIEDIVKACAPECIVLFGSFARGEDNENSDIDIGVVSNHRPEFELSKYSSRFSREINIINVNLQEASKEFRNNFINGIVVYGYLRMFK